MKGWSEVSRGVWNAEARQNVSKRQGGVFPIWNRMRSVIPGSQIVLTGVNAGLKGPHYPGLVTLIRFAGKRRAVASAPEQHEHFCD